MKTEHQFLTVEQTEEAFKRLEGAAADIAVAAKAPTGRKPEKLRNNRF